MPAPVTDARDLPERTENHVMGFLDSRRDCEALAEAMRREELAGRSMVTFDGPAALPALEELLRGSWGEAEQAFYEKALAELENGHSAVCFEVGSFDDAERVGKLAGTLGGRSFTHFGMLVDTGIET